MQPEVCHADRVRVGIAQSDAQVGGARHHKALLGGKFLTVAVYDSSAHFRSI